MPCSPAPSIGPWKQAGRSSRRSTSRQQRPRPSNNQHRLHNFVHGNTYDSEVLERSGLLNVLQGSGKVLELQVDGLLGSLSVLHSLGLESINGLDLSGDIVGDGLEGSESLLDLIDNGLVLQGRSVGGEVNGGGLLGQSLELASGILVSLLEGLEGGNGLATEAQRAGDLGPVELESCASLLGREN